MRNTFKFFTAVIISLFWLTVMVSVVIGIWHAYSKHGLLHGIASTFFPPYAIYMTYDAFYRHSDATSEKEASVVLRMDVPSVGETKLSFKHPNNVNLDECNHALPHIKDGLFQNLQQDDPSMFSNATLLGAECVLSEAIEPKTTKRPDDFIEPIVAMTLNIKNNEPATVFFPSPDEGMSLDDCNSFFNDELKSDGWLQFAYNSLKSKNKLFIESEIDNVRCIIPTEELLQKLSGI